MLRNTYLGSMAAVALVVLGACAADDGTLSLDTEPDAPSLAQAVATGGGARNTPVELNDPNLKCYKLTAYASAANKAQKYNAPTTPDYYVGFNFKAPWPGTQYIKSFRSIIDNKAVLHHWLLYRFLNGGNEGVIPTIGSHPDAELLYGWAPGAEDLWFDADVGMAVPSGSVFQLELHYNNRTGGPSPDASGVEVCVTPTAPTHVAGTSFVGTLNINGTTATGTCTHASKQPVHLILGLPHMHVKGTHMKVDLTRASGKQEVVHDAPFDFNYQVSYLENVVLQPGDKLKTTCSFSSPAKYGSGTKDEMCYFFSVHYPAGALARSSLATVIHGPNTCID